MIQFYESFLNSRYFTNIITFVEMNAKYQILDKVFAECINCVTNEGKII